jgi:hypothetical protein
LENKSPTFICVDEIIHRHFVKAISNNAYLKLHKMLKKPHVKYDCEAWEYSDDKIRNLRIVAGSARLDRNI